MCMHKKHHHMTCPLLYTAHRTLHKRVYKKLDV